MENSYNLSPDNFSLYSHEYKQLERMILEQNKIVHMLLPAYVPVRLLADMTGKSRQAIRQYLYRKCIPELDFITEHGKMLVVKEIAIQILARS